MSTALGKRYICAECGAELICTKSGEGELTCCGTAMGLKETKPLPSSD